MPNETSLLAATALAVGVLHTLAGPDHYLPFIAIARARRWSRTRALGVTALSGAGHVGSSVLIGAAGIALGAGLGRLEWIEAARGDAVAWAFVAFGLAYAVWGLRRAGRAAPHAHAHPHADGSLHDHLHAHDGGHVHVHEAPEAPRPWRDVAPWLLFAVVAFGPCEPLIPVLMYPAARGSLAGVVAVTSVFAAATVVTMVAAVYAGLAGAERLRHPALERYGHAVAGATIAACGVGIVLGL